ncbi:uncharacterized protein BDR25DRAFT_347158 [Lindgomyces ingoldianus]|uniref:Uncharacterized protein n=1 Tax=Lindgomyces ingoldianus TaxID=673940 RepID=A0ACB6Q9V3_9PLEO|nr:uncharacterized protein BDR25DRAFT_347158 [Lindgomyces ingoldianus]KAF2463676.1 hypothetical protein BDR25DRAFT_347158 [Lindgomyces ingoldianus]
MYRAHGLSRAPQLQQPRPLPLSTRGLSDQTRRNIVRFLLLGWEPQLIADREGCSRGAVYNVIRNLKEHSSVRKPPTKKLGQPPKIAREDAEALFEQLVCSGWMY